MWVLITVWHMLCINEIKNRHKGESNIWITIITGIYYIDLSVVISFVLGVKFWKCL